MSDIKDDEGGQDYRRYMSDKSFEVPRTTRWRKRKFFQRSDITETNADDIQQPRSNTAANGQDQNVDVVNRYQNILHNSHEKEFESYMADPALELGEGMNNDDGNLKDDEEIKLDDEEDNSTFDPEPLTERDENTQLYEGASVTLAASMVLIITFAMRHSLTGEALSDLLLLIELHCLTPNLCQRTLKRFMDYFKTLRSPLEFHYYCKKCLIYHGRTPVDICNVCHTERGKELSYFLVLPLVSQLISLFSESLTNLIVAYKNDQKKTSEGTMKDVMDGRLYKEKFDRDGHLRGAGTKDELHISLQINTDGVSLFKSSNFSIWPVYFVINELPPTIRFSRTYRIFGGLWFGYSKPDFKAFLKPFAESLHDLYYKGFEINGRRVRGILLSGVFDAPARCQFQDMVQFNGYYGCPYCLEPGKNVKTSERGHVHTYPFCYETSNGHAEERTHEMFQRDAELAEERKQAGRSQNQNGVKGSSWSHHITEFDVVRGTAVDYMHCVMLGVMKMLMSLWFSKCYRNQQFNVSVHLGKINQRLLNVKPANFIGRLPRSLEDLSHYKAAEYKSFMLYFSIPCLWGILPDIHMRHYLVLVQSIVLLLSDHITLEELERCKKLLMEFVINVPVLYGERYMTSNVHLLLHLVERVQDLGPLWSMSCFYFEDFNGQLRSLFHGTQNIDQQIVFAVCVHQNLPSLASTFKYGTAEQELFKKFMEKKHPTTKEIITTDIAVIGAYNTDCLSEMDRHAIFLEIGQYEQAVLFKRLKLKNNVIQSVSYKSVKKRNSSIVKYYDNGAEFGEVKTFVKAITNLGTHFLALVYTLDPVKVFENHTVPHMVPVQTQTETVKGIRVETIRALCTSCRIDNMYFLSTSPNSIEKE